MKLLYIMPFKIDVSRWHMTGDCNMARKILERLPDNINVDVIGNFGSVVGNLEELEKVKSSYNISNIIDVSEMAAYRDYSKRTFQYLGEHNLLEGYDLIHVHNSNPSMVTRINEYLSDKKTIFTLHSPPEVTTFQFYQKDEYLRFLNNPNAIFLCVSKSQSERVLNALEYYEHFPEGNPNITYILNGIETQKYDNDIVYDCGTIGRFSQSKNVLESLKCVAAITKHTGGKGFFVGTTSSYEGSSENEKRYADSIMKTLRDNPQIEWYESLPSRDIQILLSKSKSYIALSTIETFGLTVCEALMQGTPCIGFNVNGIGEIIEEGLTGYKYQKSSKRWETRYRESVEMYNKCLELDRDTIRNRTVERFNIDRVASEHVALYNEFAKEK